MRSAHVSQSLVPASLDAWIALSVCVGCGSVGFLAMREERLIGISLSGFFVGRHCRSLSWVRSSGRTSSSSLYDDMGVVAAFSKISVLMGCPWFWVMVVCVCRDFLKIIHGMSL